MTTVTTDDYGRRLDRLEIVVLEGIVPRLDKVIEDHERRIRWNERWMYSIPATFLVAIAGAVGMVIKG